MFLWTLKLPSVSYVQLEPIVVQIDRLDLVLEENDDIDASDNSSRYNRGSRSPVSLNHLF